MKKTRDILRHHTQRVTTNRLKQWKLFVHSDIEKHKFHKRKPFDCGKPQCGRCRSEEKVTHKYEEYSYDKEIRDFK